MPELTIVSFNAHAGLRPHHHGVCEPYDLAAVLRGFEADVVVIQESFVPDGGESAAQVVARDLGLALHELVLGRVRLAPWPQTTEGNGTGGTTGLSVLTRIPSTRRGTLPIGRVFGDSRGARRALLVELDVAGTPVDLVGLHLTSRLPHGPPMQMTRLRPQLPPPSRHAVVAGDHNFWGHGVERFLPGWKRAVRGRTWPASRPHSQIDHVLVRPATAVLEGRVLDDVGSDHLPIRARLRFDESR